MILFFEKCVIIHTIINPIVILDRCQGIEGKDFFLAHGMADRNVHIQNSMILAKTLVSNNIPFEQHVS